MRKLRLSLLALAILLGVIAALPAWLLYTETGAAWLWARAQEALPGRLQSESVTGSLRGGLELRGLRYRDDTVDVSLERIAFVLDPDLFAPAVNVDGLDASGVTVRLAAGDDAADDAAGAALRDVLPALRLPLPLRVRDLEVERFSLVAADDATLFAADSVALTATLHDTLRIDALDLAAGGAQASLSGELGLDALQELQAVADIDATGSALALPGLLPRAGRIALDGRLTRFAVEIAGRQPELAVTGTVSDVDRRPNLELTATAPSLPLVDAGETSVSLQAVRLQASGYLNDYRATLDGRLESTIAATLTAHAEVDGDLGGLRIARLTATSPELDAELGGRLGWAEGFSAAADIDVKRLQPGRWLSFWPSGETVSARAAVELDRARLVVERLTLAHRDTDLRGRGVVDLDAGAVDVELGWQSVQWPLAPAEPQLSSPEATLTLEGEPSDWRLAGDFLLAASGLPQGRFRLEGNGSLQRFDVAIRDSEVLGGRITGNVSVARDAGLRWTAQLDTANLSVGPLLPAWPGRISATIDAAGQAEPFELGVDIETLSGELRARPVSAAGSLLVRADSLAVDNLRLASGESTATLDGSWPSSDGVDFALDIDTLADFLPGTAGSVRATGRVGAGSPLPLLDIELDATELGWRDLSLARLSLGNRPAAAGDPFALELDASELQIGSRRVTGLRATLGGSPAGHELAIAIVSPAGDAVATFRGALENFTEPATARWNGVLSAFELRSADAFTLTLRDPAELLLSRDELQLAGGCLEDGGSGALCVAGRWSSNTNYAASFELESLPLDLLRTATGAGLEFTQRLDGAVSLATGPLGRPSGEGRIDVSPGVIRNPLDERLTLRTRAGFAAFELENGRLLSAELSLPFSEAAEIAGDFRVLDIARGADSPIAGHLTANVRNIGVGASIVPQIDEAAGRLVAEFSVDGTLGQPRFEGGATLRDGLIAYDPLGFRLEDIQVDSRILPGNRVELDSSFRAGSGSGRLRSSADYLQGLSGGFEVALTGSDLTLINLDDLRVTIDPDLEVGVRGNDVRLNGKIAVPRARLASVKFVNTGVSESDDVVLVGDEQAVESAPSRASSPLEWHGSVEFELGDEVIIDVDVAEARLRGAATYDWQGPPLPMANGAFAVSGKFEAYGQLLEITEGVIRYSNMPANNPQLRIRAEREIFGNSQVRRAGVLVGGTALRPELSVYTTPATNQNRALTLLATGSDFNFEQGIGAVDVGTYIAPDLYVGYGIGLFERENVISVRYDLARGFGIKGTSGKRAAGIDISYTIQR